MLSFTLSPFFQSTLFQVIIFCFVGLVFGAVLAGLSLLVQKLFYVGKKRLIKSSVYECGVKADGTSQIKFDIKYYIFALMFIVFDIEFVFLMPWALGISRATGTGLDLLIIEAVIFILILGFGLFYAWKKDALEWD